MIQVHLLLAKQQFLQDKLDKVANYKKRSYLPEPSVVYHTGNCLSAEEIHAALHQRWSKTGLVRSGRLPKVNQQSQVAELDQPGNIDHYNGAK